LTQLDENQTDVEIWNNGRQNYRTIKQLKDTIGNYSLDETLNGVGGVFPIVEGKVWTLNLGKNKKANSAQNNPNQEGYDGLLVVNGFVDRNNPTTYLVKNGIYEKYSGNGNTKDYTNLNATQRLGVPNSEEKGANANGLNGAKSGLLGADNAWYQTYDYGITGYQPNTNNNTSITKFTKYYLLL
jgi:hypothetical protein